MIAPPLPRRPASSASRAPRSLLLLVLPKNGPFAFPPATVASFRDARPSSVARRARLSLPSRRRRATFPRGVVGRERRARGGHARRRRRLRTARRSLDAIDAIDARDARRRRRRARTARSIEAMEARASMDVAEGAFRARGGNGRRRMDTVREDAKTRRRDDGRRESMRGDERLTTRARDAEQTATAMSAVRYQMSPTPNEKRRLSSMTSAREGFQGVASMERNAKLSLIHI